MEGGKFTCTHCNATYINNAGLVKHLKNPTKACLQSQLLKSSGPSETKIADPTTSAVVSSSIPAYTLTPLQRAELMYLPMDDPRSPLNQPDPYGYRDRCRTCYETSCSHDPNGTVLLKDLHPAYFVGVILESVRPFDEVKESPELISTLKRDFLAKNQLLLDYDLGKVVSYNRSMHLQQLSIFETETDQVKKNMTGIKQSREHHLQFFQYLDTLDIDALKSERLFLACANHYCQLRINMFASFSPRKWLDDYILERFETSAPLNVKV